MSVIPLPNLSPKRLRDQKMFLNKAINFTNSKVKKFIHNHTLFAPKQLYDLVLK